MTKRITGLLLVIAMLLTMMPLSAVAATDSRTVIDTIVGTFNGVDITPEYGEPLTEPRITITAGEPAYFCDTMYNWKKYDGTQFVYNYDDTFSAGTYRYVAQIRIDGNSGLTHVLSEELNVTVDGQEWTLGTYVSNDEFSFIFVESPVFSVWAPDDLPLTFTDSSALDIGKTNANHAIAPFSLAGYVAGGTTPYTFSKVSGPDWLTVSADGTVSGTPTVAGTNAALVVKVTDKAGASQSITIAVADTAMDPSKRTVIDTIVGTFNGVDITPEYGEPLTEPRITITAGEPAYFCDTMYNWKKYDGTKFVYNYDETFTEGTYRYVAQIRIDGNSGLTHVLSEDLNITVDGQEWTLGTYVSNDELSFIFVESPEMVVYDLSVPRLSFNANGGEGTMKNAVNESGTHTLPKCGFTPPDGKVFLGWSVNGVRYAPGDTITITENTTAVAVWGESIKFTTQPTGGTAGIGSGYQFSFATSLPITEATLQIKDPTRNVWMNDNNASMSLSSGTLSFPGAVLCVNNKSVYRVKVTDGVQTAYSDAFTVTWVEGYTVTFRANGGTGTMDAVSGVYGVYTLPACTFEAPEGKRFKYWMIGRTLARNPGDLIAVTEDTTITAAWEEIPPDVTMGDVDGNGDVDIYDALRLFKHVNEELTLEGSELAAGDVDGNGDVDIYDALRLFKFVNEEIDAL